MSEEEGILTFTSIPTDAVFSYHSEAKPILELKANGDIFVHGRLVENDKEVVIALREFLDSQRAQPKCKTCAKSKPRNGIPGACRAQMDAITGCLKYEKLIESSD